MNYQILLNNFQIALFTFAVNPNWRCSTITWPPLCSAPVSVYGVAWGKKGGLGGAKNVVQVQCFDCSTVRVLWSDPENLKHYGRKTPQWSSNNECSHKAYFRQLKGFD